MKILIYTPACTGGHAEYTFELLRGLSLAKPRDWELHLVTRQGLEAAYRSPDWRIHEALPAFKNRREFPSRADWAASRMAYNFREVRAFRALLRAERWDIVHFQEVSPVFQRRLLRQPRNGARFVYTVHNLKQHRKMAAGIATAYDRLTVAAWSRFDALVFHSDGLRKAASQALNGFKGRMEVVPHGIPSFPIKPRLPAATGRPVKLLFLGVLRPNKGLHVLLRAMAEQPVAELTIAGAITDPRYFETEIAPRLVQLQATGARVTTEFAFLEKQRMIELLQRCDYLVLPYTDFESQSGILMYAMACGVPVLASEVGALGETVKHHAVGRLYPPGSPDALLQAIRETSPADRETLEKNVRRYASEHSWAKVGEQHCNVYRAVGRQSQPRPMMAADTR